MSRITLLEMLLRAGLINENQFDEALQNRVVHGGRIGTSLIELGFVSEVDLARFLSKKLSVPYISPEYLKNISEETIAVLPKGLALKYQAIPLKLEKKKLALVMSDPSDLKAVDEISFATGFIIRPVIAPEVRLMQALALYYGAEVPSRYLQIAKRLETERQLATLAEPMLEPLPELISEPESEPESEPLPELMSAPFPEPLPELISKPEKIEKEEFSVSEQEPESIVDEVAEKEVQPLPIPEVAPSEASSFETASAEAIAGAENEMESEDELLIAEIIEDDWVGQVVKYSIDEVSQKLSWACDREEIAQILIEYMGSRFERSAIFTLRGGAAYGWKAACGEKEIPYFHQFRLPLDSPSVLKMVAEEGKPHMGPIPETVSNALLREALGGIPAESILLVPILVTGTTVGVVYGEKNGGDLDEEYLELKKVLFKTGLAFEILICREKIQMMTGT